MRARSFYLSFGLVLAFVTTLSGGLYALLRHEPAFYTRARVPPGDQRQQASSEFVAMFSNEILSGIINHKSWDARFTQEQVNSYFAEDLVTKHSAETPLPESIAEPRVAFEPERVRIGFRYGKGWTSTVISLDIRAWLVRQEPNVVALEFQALHAGAIRFSAQSLLERIADAFHKHDVDPTWYRHNGNPVLLLRFQARRSRPTFQLQKLELRSDVLRLVGRSTDSVSEGRPAAENRVASAP